MLRHPAAARRRSARIPDQRRGTHRIRLPHQWHGARGRPARGRRRAAAPARTWAREQRSTRRTTPRCARLRAPGGLPHAAAALFNNVALLCGEIYGGTRRDHKECTSGRTTRRRPRRRDAELRLLPGATRRPARRARVLQRGAEASEADGGAYGAAGIRVSAASLCQPHVRRGRAGAVRSIIKEARGPRRRPGAQTSGDAEPSGQHAYCVALPGLRVLPSRRGWEDCTPRPASSRPASRRTVPRNLGPCASRSPPSRRQHVARLALRQRLQGPAGEIFAR